MTFQRLPKPSHSRRLSPGTAAESTRLDYNRQKPTFCLQHVDSSYCITGCIRDDKAAFADKIRRLSTMTWNEIINSPRHGMGFETIDKRSIRSPIPAHITDDTTMIAFRFSGMKAMIGYRFQAMFHIVWFDRDYNLYDHG